MTTTTPQPNNSAPAGANTNTRPGAGARGQQGQGGRPQGRRRNVTRYGTQMREKQDLKAIYGIRDGQLRTYFKRAMKAKGETGPVLIGILESRLDNSVFRAGFAQTRPQARQMVSHAFFLVNGKKVDVPSFMLKEGDVVSIKESKREKSYFSSFDKRLQNVRTPSWITPTINEFSFTFSAKPVVEEANIGVDMRAVVEFFAR